MVLFKLLKDHILAAAAAAREAAAEREGILEAAPVPTQRAEERVAEMYLGGMGFNQVSLTVFGLIVSLELSRLSSEMNYKTDMLDKASLYKNGFRVVPFYCF